MRILTVKQPWAWAIMFAGKDVENRVRNLAGSYRGPVAIHAGLKPVPENDHAWEVPGYRRALDHASSIDRRMLDARGQILGIVDLTGVHRCTHPGGICYEVGTPNGIQDALDAGRGRCSKWGEHGAWHLQLANPRPLIQTVPYTGALGLRTLPQDVTDQIIERLRP